MRNDEAIIDQTNHWTTNRHLSDLRRLVVYAYNAMSLIWFNWHSFNCYIWLYIKYFRLTSSIFNMYCHLIRRLSMLQIFAMLKTSMSTDNKSSYQKCWRWLKYNSNASNMKFYCCSSLSIQHYYTQTVNEHTKTMLTIIISASMIHLQFRCGFILRIICSIFFGNCLCMEDH